MTIRHCEACNYTVDIYDEPDALAIGGDMAPDSWFCQDIHACIERQKAEIRALSAELRALGGKVVVS